MRVRRWLVAALFLAVPALAGDPPKIAPRTPIKMGSRPTPTPITPAQREEVKAALTKSYTAFKKDGNQQTLRAGGLKFTGTQAHIYETNAANLFGLTKKRSFGKIVKVAPSTVKLAPKYSIEGGITTSFTHATPDNGCKISMDLEISMRNLGGIPEMSDPLPRLEFMAWADYGALFRDNLPRLPMGTSYNHKFPTVSWEVPRGAGGFCSLTSSTLGGDLRFLDVGAAAEYDLEIIYNGIQILVDTSPPPSGGGGVGGSTGWLPEDYCLWGDCPDGSCKPPGQLNCSASTF